MKTTTTTAAENFEEIAHQLMASAPTEKAACFAQKQIDAVRARGDEWIEKNKMTLRVDFVPGPDMFPVCDNRAFYVSAFQMTLLTK